MEQEQHTSLFELRVNEKGKSYIRKFYRLAIPVLIFLILTLVANLYLTIKYINKLDARISLSLRVTTYFNISISLLNFLAVAFYVRFANSLRRSLTVNDEEMFNESFRYLSQNALLFLVTLIMSFLSWSWTLTVGWVIDKF